MKEKYYLTTAIAYTSKIPHIGNMYEIILSDAIARYKRQKGYDVFFLTGTDEHGQKIEENAIERGVTPKEHVDYIAGEIRRIMDRVNISYNDFIRTTDPRHMKVVQKIFKILYDKGHIYKGKYEGLYCVPDETFLTEAQLVDGNCPHCNRPVERQSEEAYFLKLSDFEKEIREFIETSLYPVSRRNEMINNFLDKGLKDLCVSRTSFKWGVPVDFDDNHVVYVWIDALSNYITAIGYDPDGSSELFNKNWPADVHIIGKDIVRFHTIYWPAILTGIGVELPKCVFGHPWLLTGDEKMSKSLGNVVYADDLIDLFGVDAVRYYVLREIPYANDGNLTYDNMISRLNTDFANILGNLVNRTISMTDKYFNGIIPLQDELLDVDKDLIEFALSTPKYVDEKMNSFMIADAIERIMELLRKANKYIDLTEPWKLNGTDADKRRLGTVLYNLLEAIRFSAIMLYPFVPETSENIFKQINSRETSLESLSEFNATVSGDKLGEKEVLFERMDREKKLEEIQAYLEEKNSNGKIKPNYKDEIEFDDFLKVDLKVAKVLDCKKHPNADKLLVFNLEVGRDTRQIISGIAAHYKPEELMGKSVIIVANLKPRKLRGLESNGMILSVASEDMSELKVLSTDMESGLDVC